MRKITANYIFPVSRPPIKNGIITLNNKNEIIDLEDNGDALPEKAGLEYYNGVLVPGFINCHTHLELSHLRNRIPEKPGMQGFIQAVRQSRDKNDNVEQKIRQADTEMVREGIVAALDIANQGTTLNQKKKSLIQYITLIELFGLNPDENENKLAHAHDLVAKFKNDQQPTALTLHTLYSLNNQLAKTIIEENNFPELPLSIHHLESEGELNYIENDTGLLKKLMEQINNNHPVENTELLTYRFLQWINRNKRLLLVHNIQLKEKLIREIVQSHPDTWWVLCPNSNLFIHDTLPPVNVLMKNSENICLGTDSLASNQRLSILSEMKTLQQAFPSTSFATLLQWGTLNGARALNLSDKFGSFEAGKTPGINLLQPFDFNRMQPSEKTVVKKLA